jgi:two-component system CheB/CheR fusion protein
MDTHFDAISTHSSFQDALGNRKRGKGMSEISNGTGDSSRSDPTGRDPETEEQRGKPFPVVAIGASAGGLEAFSDLLKALPGNTGMAYVYIQHLDPSHKSMLSEILSKSTAMPIGEAEDGMKIEPDRVYVIPPNTNIAVFHGTLILMPRLGSPKPHRPIDYFFSSLAEDKKSRAIGVVLSGTATDGSQGIKAIKEAGGITLAQDFDSAKYDGMPRSAVATGYIDLVLPPARIAEELVRIGNHPYLVKDMAREESLLETEGETLTKIFAILRTSANVDFTDYKQSTIKRRIARRMVLHRIDTLESYLHYVQENTGEVENLFRDLLINVTSFFRNPEQFEALKEKVFPEIVAARTRDKPLRIWIPGCATGEEAYSIAITLLEFIEETGQGQDVPAQIFATDVSEEYVSRARMGIYLEKVADDVSPERLHRFFSRQEDKYEIRKYVRDMCVFARHDVTKDPPFSQMDLISIRNLLIYLGPVLQRRIIPMLHYALKPSGFMMLGTSESIGRFADLFSLADKQAKIYKKKVAISPVLVDFTSHNRAWDPTRHEIAAQPAVSTRSDPTQEADNIMLDRYAPLGVVVNEDMNIIYTRGSSDRFLELPIGRASLNVLKMARGNLEYELRTLIRRAEKGEMPARKENVELEYSGETAKVSMEVIPITGSYPEGRVYLILFEEIPGLTERGEKKAVPGEVKPEGKKKDSRQVRIEELERELTAAREYIRSTSEEHDAMVEELRSANEEIISANEELQSTNEELETAKEELQSSNEELTTLNEELAVRNSELREVNDDLSNVLSGIDIPVVIIRGDLSVSRYTPSAREIFHIKPSDVGRSIDEVKPRVKLPDLREITLEVMETLLPQTLEVEADGDRWYNLVIRPYKTVDNRIDGVVMEFMDTTVLKRELDLLIDYYEPIIDTVREPLVILDAGLRVTSANRSFYRTFQVNREETEGKYIFDLGGRQWDIPKLRELLEEIIPTNVSLDDYKVEHDFQSIGRKSMLLNARQIERKAGAAPLILLAIEDVTERRSEI